MATKNIIARGIGFDPGSVKFVVTHGFSLSSVVELILPSVRHVFIFDSTRRNMLFDSMRRVFTKITKRKNFEV